MRETAYKDATLTLRDGRRLAFSDIGHKDARPVLYLHGNPGSRTEVLRPSYLDAFAASRLRVITVDRPGYGESDPPGAKGHLPFTADLRELMDHLCLERVAVVGHSRGTLPAIGLGVVLADRITAVGAFGPTGLPDDPDLLRTMTPEGCLMLRLVKSAPLIARLLLRTNVLLDRAFPKTAVTRIARVLPSPADREQLRQRGQEFIDGLAKGMKRDVGFAVDDWRSWLVDPLGFDPTAIRIPVLLWTGAEDRTCPPRPAEAMAKRIPSARAHLLADIGHLHTPEVLVSLMEATLKAGQPSNAAQDGINPSTS